MLDKKAYLPIVKPLFPLLNVRNNWLSIIYASLWVSFGDTQSEIGLIMIDNRDVVGKTIDDQWSMSLSYWNQKYNFLVLGKPL